MNKSADPADTPRAVSRSRSDLGSTFIELLVSIVLLGTVVVGVLVALQASIVASTTDADHARAYVLLHEASDAVFVSSRMSCVGNTEAQLVAHYESAFSGLTSPQGWESVSPVVTNIEFLNAADSSGATVYSWGPLCFEGPVDADGNGTIEADEDFTNTPLRSQKITLQVTSPSGSFTKSLETVKR